ncbi:hypothetical protein M407DRAFT_88569 [Tulasnella calospora MUT 4182]|uniref:Uncharacterized protein n=1 Tax=Tulasnella calospora MUT 4182 TaxID=1051891 RepID=A0A0C3MLP0_9AGAM|nr:hypothetical protein M407DRAFT_88569 [Tulasnella calospora MUT 4182]
MWYILSFHHHRASGPGFELRTGERTHSPTEDVSNSKANSIRSSNRQWNAYESINKRTGMQEI